MTTNVQNMTYASPPILSVVLCTYNNAESLSVTLAQLAQQQIRTSEDAEIIVVDNNSSDHTKKVVTEAIAASSVQIKYLFEPKQGLSNARNTGVNYTSGEYIIFTDDDADIPANWIDQYLAIIEKEQPECVYSKISVVWDREKPWWYSHRYRPFFVELDYGDNIINVRCINKEFFGKNFCIKKSTLIDLGMFNPKLGRNGSQLIAGEETLIYRRLIERSLKVIYIPNAPVGHRLKDREYSEDNIRKQMRDSAASNFYLAKFFSRRSVLGRPIGFILTTLASLPKTATLALYSAIKGNKSDALYYSARYSMLIRQVQLWLINR